MVDEIAVSPEDRNVRLTLAGETRARVADL
jgi:hypothetical protein